ncbi:MAG: DNA polymerase III subunit chi [Pseudomonadota bacterium]
MVEVLFYHLTATPLERTLPGLLEKSLERGWRVVVRCGSEAGLGMLDGVLWTYSDASFLPHGTAASAYPDQQPVFLTLGSDVPNRANVLMLVDGARAVPDEMQAFNRVCLLFDGNDEAVVETARADWRAVSAAGLSAKYWAQERGTWVQKASN